MDVVFALNIRLGGGVGIGDGHYTRDVLEVIVIVHLHLNKHIEIDTFVNS